MFRRKNKTARTKGRFGNATVELAVCLPVLVLIVFGSLQASSMYFLRQAMVQSAYEGVKEAARSDGSQALARTRSQQTLAFRNITGETISFFPANSGAVAPGTPITVTVSAPGDQNSVLPFGVFSGRTVSASATMNKE